MTKLLAVYRREVGAYFLSPAAYVFMGVFLLLTGWLFSSRLFVSQYVDMQVVFANMTFIFVFIAPLLTMRLLAEERRLGTEELLLTAPLTSGQIIAGKYLAGLTVYFAFLVLTCVYPWLLHRFSFPDWTLITMGYLGVALVGAAYLAVGLLASSLTGSQMVAGLVGFGCLLLLLVVDQAAVVTTGLVGKTLKALSVASRSNGLHVGLVRFADILFLLSFTSGLLFLTVRVMEHRRRQGGGGPLRRGAAQVALTVGVLVVLVLANAGAARVAPVVDLTKEHLYTLSTQTQQLLERLDTDVEILVFGASRSFYRSDLEGLLDQYRRASLHIHYDFVDPDLQPALAQVHQVTQSDLIVINVGERSRRIPLFLLFSPGDHPDGIKFTGEQAINQTILELTRERVRPILFLTGHGEPDPFETLPDLVQSLRREMYRVETINLARRSLPEEAALAVLMAPVTDPSSDELAAVGDWLETGGRLIVLLDPAPSGTFPNLLRFLAEFGIVVHETVVVDPERALFSDSMTPIARLDWHPLTEDLIGRDLAVALPRARSMAAGTAPPGHQVNSVFGTSEAAWGERDLSATPPASDPGDVRPPFSMAMSVVRVDDDGNVLDPVMLVVGNSGFLRPAIAEFQGNTDFFLNTLNWLAGDVEQISIRPKQRILQRIFLTSQDARLVFNITVIFLPLGAFSLAIVAWLRRRNR